MGIFDFLKKKEKLKIAEEKTREQMKTELIVLEEKEFLEAFEKNKGYLLNEIGLIEKQLEDRKFSEKKEEDQLNADLFIYSSQYLYILLFFHEAILGRKQIWGEKEKVKKLEDWILKVGLKSAQNFLKIAFKYSEFSTPLKLFMYKNFSKEEIEKRIKSEGLTVVDSKMVMELMVDVFEPRQ